LDLYCSGDLPDDAEASGLMAGPLRPPVMLPRTGFFRFQSIAKPTKVFE